MTDSGLLAETRARLSLAGISAADKRWLDGMGWSDAAVPPIADEAEAADYARREAVLNAAIADLPLPDRMIAVESKLAAAIGARIADWRERDEEE